MYHVINYITLMEKLSLENCEGNGRFDKEMRRYELNSAGSRSYPRTGSDIADIELLTSVPRELASQAFFMQSEKCHTLWVGQDCPSICDCLFFYFTML
jgi:hypothetical protein